MISFFLNLGISLIEPIKIRLVGANVKSRILLFFSFLSELATYTYGFDSLLDGTSSFS